MEWQNSILIHSDIAKEIAKLKQLPGKNLIIIGSPRLAHTFMRLGLIDEYRINVNPVLLGKGIPYFQNVQEVTKLKHIDNTKFHSGVIGLVYQPENE